MSAGNWWARRWEAVVRELGIGGADGSTKGDARRAARVRRMEVIPGGISAAVQDRQTGACSIEVRVQPLSSEQWDWVSDALSSQPLVSTQLLSGAVPPEIEQIFADAGAHLLPASASEFTTQCSCCSPAPCRHLPLLFGLFAEMLNDDPGVLFVLRGRERQQILRDIREARGTPQAAAAPSPNNAPISRDAPARAPAAEPDGGLAADLEHYWGDRKLIKQFHHHIAPPEVELVLLRRLGPIRAGDDAMALYEQLVALYRRITDEAIALAYSGSDADEAQVGNGATAYPANGER